MKLADCTLCSKGTNYSTIDVILPFQLSLNEKEPRSEYLLEIKIDSKAEKEADCSNYESPFISTRPAVLELWLYNQHVCP